MEIDHKELKRLIKEAVAEALSEANSGDAQKAKSEGKDSKKTTLSYKEVFQRIMMQVARGEIDEQTAGKLIAEARIAFDAQEEPPKAEKQQPQSPAGSPTLIERLAEWEREVQHYKGRAAETTLEMMERMRMKLEKEAQEAAFFKAEQEMEKEAAQQKAAEDLKNIKERIAKGE